MDHILVDEPDAARGDARADGLRLVRPMNAVKRVAALPGRGTWLARRAGCPARPACRPRIPRAPAAGGSFAAAASNSAIRICASHSRRRSSRNLRARRRRRSAWRAPAFHIEKMPACGIDDDGAWPLAPGIGDLLAKKGGVDPRHVDGRHFDSHHPRSRHRSASGPEARGRVAARHETRRAGAEEERQAQQRTGAGSMCGHLELPFRRRTELAIRPECSRAVVSTAKGWVRGNLVPRESRCGDFVQSGNIVRKSRPIMQILRKRQTDIEVCFELPSGLRYLASGCDRRCLPTIGRGRRRRGETSREARDRQPFGRRAPHPVSR